MVAEDAATHAAEEPQLFVGRRPDAQISRFRIIGDVDHMEPVIDADAEIVPDIDGPGIVFADDRNVAGKGPQRPVADGVDEIRAVLTDRDFPVEPGGFTARQRDRPGTAGEDRPGVVVAKIDRDRPGDFLFARIVNPDLHRNLEAGNKVVEGLRRDDGDIEGGFRTVIDGGDGNSVEQDALRRNRGIGRRNDQDMPGGLLLAGGEVEPERLPGVGQVEAAGLDFPAAFPGDPVGDDGNPGGSAFGSGGQADLIVRLSKEHEIFAVKFKPFGEAVADHEGLAAGEGLSVRALQPVEDQLRIGIGPQRPDQGKSRLSELEVAVEYKVLCGGSERQQRKKGNQCQFHRSRISRLLPVGSDQQEGPVVIRPEDGVVEGFDMAVDKQVVVHVGMPQGAPLQRDRCVVIVATEGGCGVGRVGLAVDPQHVPHQRLLRRIGAAGDFALGVAVISGAVVPGEIGDGPGRVVKVDVPRVSAGADEGLVDRFAVVGEDGIVQVRPHEDDPVVLHIGRAVPAADGRRGAIVAVGGGVGEVGHSDLFEIAGAFDRLGPVPRLVEGGQEHGGQDDDDGNHH